MKILTFSLISLLALTPAVAKTPENTATLVAEGEAIFAEHCASCHDNSDHMINDNGPALFGVMGRKVASVDGYDYSDGLEKGAAKGHVWTPKRMNKFLVNPSKMYAGTTMPMTFADAHKRKAVVAYLGTLK